ncbi:dienelactone hydrolase family protein [Candidatus Reidiella endopervernicosa]|uniref:dienelactone hydrolase family protein n=1 Tax=Candidatus Reidiella endopervernicosa TaxID=2738883 RepID=UPI002A4E183F|nr:dienelactone hydrolase family protein [Candidatus Reidiella endopervernicosa]
MKQLLILLTLFAATLHNVEAAFVGEEIQYSSGDTVMKGYLAYDNEVKDKRPGILVVHEWWGHNEYARKRARMLAEMGYVALAVDMYGDGKQAAHPRMRKIFR